MDINTVSGIIDVNALGNVLSHEHILIYSPIMRGAFGEKLFDIKKATERAIRLLTDAKEKCGIDTIIDGTPIDLGRNIEAIRTASEKSGVNIIISSGMYITEEHYMNNRKPQDMAKYFIAECTEGINGTNVKPGMLKCATGKNGFTDINKMMLDAMSITQYETNLPLYAHNTHSLKTGYDQLKIFENNKVNLEKLVMGHCSDTDDVPYLLNLAKSGCFLGFDRIYPDAFEKQAKVIYELINQGYEDKLLVSHDYFAYSDSSGDSFEKICNSGRDFMTVHKKLLPELKKCGVSDNQIHKLTYENPQRLFS